MTINVVLLFQFHFDEVKEALVVVLSKLDLDEFSPETKDGRDSAKIAPSEEYKIPLQKMRILIYLVARQGIHPFVSSTDAMMAFFVSHAPIHPLCRLVA